MNSRKRPPSVVALALLLSLFIPAAHADGICAPRTLTAIDANTEKINALMMKAQEAAVANRFAEVESLTRQADALMPKNTALMGLEQSDAQAEKIEAEAASPATPRGSAA